MTIINTQQDIGYGAAVDLAHMGAGWQRSRKEVKEYIKNKQNVHKSAKTARRSQSAVQKEAALKSKIRAASYVNGKSDFRKLFEYYDKDGSGELDQTEFLRAMRKDGKISKRNFSDDELRDIFKAIDADGNGVVDADEFLIWFGLSKSARHRLPQLKSSTKMTPASGNNTDRNAHKRRQQRRQQSTSAFIIKNKSSSSSNAKDQPNMEMLSAMTQKRKSLGPGLTKFWCVVVLIVCDFVQYCFSM